MKTGNKTKLHCICIMVCACFFILNSCGLESFYFLEPPLDDGHTVYYTSEDGQLRYFSFMTNENGDNNEYIGGSSSFSFLGTEVYYKIFNNYSTMLSWESSISSLNSGNNVSSAAEKLIETYKYRPLNLAFTNRNPLVTTSSIPSNRYVYIRLNDYGSDVTTSRAVMISKDSAHGGHSMSYYDETDLSSYELIDLPRRYIDSKYGFNFNKDDEDNPLPVSGDEDLELDSTASEEGVWYVDMYAVSIGRDEEYSSSYSRVLLLGSIKITESDYNK